MTNYNFNENAKVTRAQFKKLIFQLTPYKELIKGGDEKEEGESAKKTVSTEQIEHGRKVLLFVAETQDSIKAKLVSIFFDLTDKEVEDMEFDIFEELYQIIIQKKPNLVDFLILTPVGEKKATSSTKENTLTSSAASVETTPLAVENTPSLN
jgi:hypothetical protein